MYETRWPNCSPVPGIVAAEAVVPVVFVVVATVPTIERVISVELSVGSGLEQIIEVFALISSKTASELCDTCANNGICPKPFIPRDVMTVVVPVPAVFVFEVTVVDDVVAVTLNPAAMAAFGLLSAAGESLR